MMLRSKHANLMYECIAHVLTPTFQYLSMEKLEVMKVFTAFIWQYNCQAVFRIKSRKNFLRKNLYLRRGRLNGIIKVHTHPYMMHVDFQ